MTVDHAARREHTRARLRQDELDALWVTHLPNVRWLTGFTGSAGMVLIGPEPETDLLCSDGRYDEQCANESPDIARHIARSGQAEHAIGVLADAGATSVGFEADRIDWRSGSDLTALAADVGIEARPTVELVDQLRAVKDTVEVEILRRACEITDEAFADMLDWLEAGMTEREVAVRLERTMVDAGAETVAFPSIVASGPNSALPHHRPTERVLAAGELVKFDFGARYGGYHADMSRTVSLGEPPDLLREIHDLVRTSQQAGVDAATAGVVAETVDAACRDPIEAAGYGERFVHGTGHGVGLEIHEWPRVSRGSRATLGAGTAFTVEPGVYLPGTGGVRIEDTVVTRADGPPDVLTTSPREMIIL